MVIDVVTLGKRVKKTREDRGITQETAAGSLGVPRTAIDRMDGVRPGSSVPAEERKRLGLGEAPVHGLPDLLSNQDLWIAGVNVPDEMSGLFLRHSSIGIVILVNRCHPRPRKRFSLAHEY